MLKTSFQLRTIGTLLRERRRERKLTVGQISEITKIRAEYLKAIEEGNYDIFPSEVYLKGFLKNYAKFLKVNTERALAMYRRERDYKRNEPVISVTQKIKESGFNLTITPGKIIAIVLIGAVIMALFYIGSYIGRIFREPELKLLNPITLSSGGEETLKTNEDSIQIEGEVEIGASLTINGQEFQTNNFKRFSEEFDLQSGINKFVLLAESQFGRESEIILNVFKESETTENDVAGVKVSPSPTSEPAELTLTGSVFIENREAYVELTLDDELVTGRVLQVGEQIDFKKVKRVKLFTPRPDALVVTVNDKAQTVDTTVVTWEVIAGEIVKK